LGNKHCIRNAVKVKQTTAVTRGRLTFTVAKNPPKIGPATKPKDITNKIRPIITVQH